MENIGETDNESKNLSTLNDVYRFRSRGIEPSGRLLIVLFAVDLLRGRIFKHMYRSLCLDLETYVNYA